MDGTAATDASSPPLERSLIETSTTTLVKGNDQVGAESPVTVTGVHIGEKALDRPTWWGPSGPLRELMPAWIPVGDSAGTVIGYVKNAAEYWALPPEQLATSSPPDREVWGEDGVTVIGCQLKDGTYATYGNSKGTVIECES